MRSSAGVHGFSESGDTGDPTHLWPWGTVGDGIPNPVHKHGGTFSELAKGSSTSWVAKLKGAKNSECKLSNGWSRSHKVIKMLLSAGNEWSRSYRVTNQHPNLPWNFMTHGFLDLSRTLLRILLRSRLIA